jgi:hypothetical protein
MLNVIALNGIMLSVVAPLEYLKSKIVAQKTMMTSSMITHTSANSDQKKSLWEISWMTSRGHQT